MSVKKMFFCYERNHVDGAWSPIVYYDEVPALNSAGKESAPTRSKVWDVPEFCIKPDGEPSFKRLVRNFEAPK